jgi:hypothetical protein
MQSQEEQRITQVLQDRIAAVKAENSMLQADDSDSLPGVSAEDLREEGIPSLAARRIAAAAGKEEQLAPSTVETVRARTVFVACARAVAVMVA